MSAIVAQQVATKVTGSKKGRAAIALAMTINPINPINWIIYIVSLFIAYGIAGAVNPSLTTGQKFVQGALWGLLIYFFIAFGIWYVVALGTNKALKLAPSGKAGKFASLASSFRR